MSAVTADGAAMRILTSGKTSKQDFADALGEVDDISVTKIERKVATYGDEAQLLKKNSYRKKQVTKV